MGNVETMKRGDVQMTSGGTGIRHSEYNDHDSYVIASTELSANLVGRRYTSCKFGRYRFSGVSSRSTTPGTRVSRPIAAVAGTDRLSLGAKRHFADEEKLDKVCCIIAPVTTQGVIDKREANGPTPVRLIRLFFILPKLTVF